jgi:muconolactone delta-isomerase
MTFLALLRRKTEQFSDEEITKYLEPEAERARALYTQGVFRHIWSRGDVKGAVIQLECEDLPEARRVLDSLPFSQQGFADIDIVPLLPYRGFAPRQS